MKVYHGLLVAGLMLAPTPLAYSQTVYSVRDILRECPDIDAARICPSLMSAILAPTTPSPRRDGQIVSLVLMLAEAAVRPRVSFEACRNTADGMMVLADGVTNADQANEIREIAISLCQPTRTTIARSGPPRSILTDSGGSGGGAVATSNPDPDPGPGDDDDHNGGGDDHGDDDDDDGGGHCGCGGNEDNPRRDRQ